MEKRYLKYSKTNKDDYYAKAIYDSIEGNSNEKIEAGKTTVLMLILYGSFRSNLIMVMRNNRM